MATERRIAEQTAYFAALVVEAITNGKLAALRALSRECLCIQPVRVMAGAAAHFAIESGAACRQQGRVMLAQGIEPDALLRCVEKSPEAGFAGME
jgi:hypothetical protein